MAIVFRCEECGRRYRVGMDKAGRRARCRDCGAEMRVPSPPDVDRLPSGGGVIRYQPRQRELQPAIGDSENIEAIGEHVARHIGEAATVFHELISDLVHIDVHVVEPTPERPFYTLFTTGMSDLPMTVPSEELDDFRHLELMIYLPADWPLSQEAFEDEANYWPVRLLKMLARFPHEYESWLGLDHTVPNGDPPEPYAANTKFVCAMLVAPILEEDDFWRLDLPDKTIRFLTILPLYAEETDYKLRHGAEALTTRFAEFEISPVLDLTRRNVCRKRFRWL